MKIGADVKHYRELIIIIFLSLAVRLPWLAMIPQAEAPDEIMHRWVINYISNNWRLPDRQIVVQSGAEASYGSMPPFGYLPHIILLKLFQPNISAPLNRLITLRHLITRLGSLCMSLIVIAAAWWMGRKLYFGNHLAAIALPLLMVFHPQFVFVSSYTNSDITAAAVSSLILVVIVVSLNNGFSMAAILSLAALLSWLILSKYSGLPLLFAACLFLPVIAYQNRQKHYIWLRYLLSLLFLIALMTGWWFFRNYYQFDGDITGIKTMNNLWTTAYHRHIDPTVTLFSIVLSSRFWRLLFFSFWGWFGYMTHALPRIIYYIYLGFVMLACWFGIQRWQSIKTLLQVKVEIKNRADQARAWTWFLFVVCFFLNLAVVVYCSYTQIAGAQGRYLFPSEIPIMSMLIAGLLSAKKKWGQALIIALLAFNFMAYCYSSFYLYQLYCQT